VRIGVAATPDVAIPVLEWLLTSHHELALVISQPDRPAGRGREVSSSSVSRWALTHGVPLLQPEKSEELIGIIDGLDLVVTIGYGVLLPEHILTLPRHGCINLHFSLLPKYRGAAPAQRAIENGESVTGVTVFALDKGMDTGPIYRTREITIDPQWRTQELLISLSEIGPGVVEEALNDIDAGVAPRPQTGSSSSAHKINRDEAKIMWDKNASVILQRIRAFYPAPCAWTTWRDESFKITRAAMFSAQLIPGEIALIDGNVVVGCGQESAISLVSVIPAGKKEMSASEWARGARLMEGSTFG